MACWWIKIIGWCQNTSAFYRAVPHAEDTVTRSTKKNTKMLKFVKIVIKLDRRGFLGENTHLTSVVIADRLL